MVAVAIGLLAGASLGEAANHKAKPTHSCRWRHHHHVCPTRHTKPRRVTTTSSCSTSTASSTSTTTTTATTTHTQTTATQTTASSTTQASLPRGTEVDENATGQQSPFYALTAYEPTLAAGTIHFNVYNYDQDPHTFAIADSQSHQISATFQLPAGHTGAPVTVTANLAPGTYVLFCTLPQHAASGMQSTIVVK
jgi:plastocyanin